MRLLVSSTVAGLLMLGACSEAWAFGRGALGQGTNPQTDNNVTKPYGNGVAGGAVGGAHGYSPGQHSPGQTGGVLGMGVVAGQGPGSASSNNPGTTSSAPPIYTVPRVATAPPVYTLPRATTIPPIPTVPPAIVPSVRGRQGENLTPEERFGWEGRFETGTYRGKVVTSNTPRGRADLGYGTHYVSPMLLGDTARAVRGGGYGITRYGGYGENGAYPTYTATWFEKHPGGWIPTAWSPGLGFWGFPHWDLLATYLGITGLPIDYDYGNNAVISDGIVYVNGESLGTAVDYALQAIALVDVGRTAIPDPTGEWRPIGVFGIVRDGDTIAQRIVQLAVNKAGIVRGNYFDPMTDTLQLVYGMVDPKTQRVAWSVGNRKDIVFEAGLNNILQNETTILVHYGKTLSRQMILVRIPPPPVLSVPRE